MRASHQEIIDSIEAKIAAFQTQFNRLIIAARVVCYEDRGPEAIKELDEALEAFAEEVPWDDEPEKN